MTAPLDRADRGVAALLAAFAGAILLALVASGVRLTQDDGFYYFKIAQNLAAGRGATFDGLHPTNGYHPLWLLVLAPLFALQPDPARALAAGAVLQAVLGALAVGAVYAAARATLGRAGAALAALLWLGFTYSIVLSGVEFALHALLLALVAGAFLRLDTDAGRRGPMILGALLALLCLARLDCILLALILGATLLLRTRGRGGAAWWVLAPSLAAAALYAAVDLRLFGTPFPISGMVKRSWSAALLAEDPVYVRAGWVAAKAWQLAWPWRQAGNWPLRALMAGGLGAALLALLPAWPRPALLAWWRQRVLRPWAPFIAFGAAQLAAYVALYHGPHTFTRWYYAVQPLLAALLCGAAADALLHAAPRPGLRARRAMVGLLCALAVAATLRGAWRQARQQAAVRVHGPLYRAAAWAGAHLPPGARIGTWNAGIIGYLSQRQVVNLDGLVNTRAFFETERRDLCAYWDDNAIAYVVDVFQPATSVIDGTSVPVAPSYAACAGRLDLLWQDGAPGEPGWPKAYRLRPRGEEARP